MVSCLGSNMESVMDFQVVVLAGGDSQNLFPLVSKDIPKALLPVANRPVLSYVLELLEGGNLKNIIVVAEGESAAVRIGGWVSEAYVDRLSVEVAAVDQDVGTAGALRAVSHRLTSSDILVVSGDLVCDVPPGVVAATHRRQDAALTALLCSPPTSGPSESGAASSMKDKTKKAGQSIIGLNTSGEFLLFVQPGMPAGRDLCIQSSILRAAGQMEIRSDLVDAHFYAFRRSVLIDVLDQKPGIRSIKDELVPYLVRLQLTYKSPSDGEADAGESQNGSYASPKKESFVLPLHQQLARLQVVDQHGSLGISESKADVNVLKCCAYIANSSRYCARLNSIQAFGDINRDVIGEATHLTGYTLSNHNNIVHPSAVFGTKTTIGPYCMLGEGSQMGDKCSVKRSIVGRHCRIGSNVKIINSVVMNHVTIEDGCHIQGSIVCSNVHLQERSTLKDCQVGSGYVVPASTEYRSEALAKKDRV